MVTMMDQPKAEIETPTLKDVVDRLGGIPLSRILARPAPGTAHDGQRLRQLMFDIDA